MSDVPYNIYRQAVEAHGKKSEQVIYLLEYIKKLAGKQKVVFEDKELQQMYETLFMGE